MNTAAREVLPAGDSHSVEAAPSTSDRYAIVVGIDRYPALTDLRGACNDAAAFHEWLISPSGGGVPAAHARLHLGREAADARGAAPKKWQLDADLDDCVTAARATPTRTTRLYLYFAGHGIAAGAGSAAWLMADAKQNMFTNLALAPYQTWLDRCRDFDEVMIVSDCCRTIMTKVPEAPQPHTLCDQPARREQRVFLAHAADVGERAFESRGDDARGFLTRALLEGLGGAAMDAASGEVRATSLAAHVRARVRELSAGRQRAQLTFDDRIVFVAHPVERHVVMIVLHEHAAPRTVRVLAGNDVVASEVRGGGEWQLQLPDGQYQLLDDASSSIVRFTVAGATQRVTA